MNGVTNAPVARILVIAALRAGKPELPVVVLTARGSVRDRVAGLDAGATDYLVKPFALAELAARVRAHIRTAARPDATTLGECGIEVDLLSRQVQRDGHPVRRTATAARSTL